MARLQVLWFFLALAPAMSWALTQTQYTDLLAIMTNYWRFNANMQPAVRLSFHDCVGGCDGCINQDNGSNDGLAAVIDELELLWPTYDTSTEYNLTRADFWQVAAIGAIKQGVGASNRNCGASGECETMLELDEVEGFAFRTGRVDCGSSHSTTDDHEFPEPTMTGDEMFAYYARTDGPGFGFTADEVVALMGAHTLGSMKKVNSGYAGPWKVGGGAKWFNNQFYQLMLDSSITWTPMYNAGNRRSPKYQFRATNSNGADVSNMLNTDFELLYHLDLDPTTFEAGCEVNVAIVNCTERATTHDLTVSYANDATSWMEDFAAVFSKMIENGYTDSDLQDLQ